MLTMWQKTKNFEFWKKKKKEIIYNKKKKWNKKEI